MNAARVGAWESRSCPRCGTCACSWRRPGCSPATWPTIAGRGWRPSSGGRWRKWSSRGVTTWRCPGGGRDAPTLQHLRRGAQVPVLLHDGGARRDGLPRLGEGRHLRRGRGGGNVRGRTHHARPVPSMGSLFGPPSVLRRVPHCRAGPWVSHSPRLRHEAASSRRADSARRILSTGTRGTKYGDPGYKVRGPGVQSTGTRGTKYETTLKNPDLLVFLVVSQSALLFLLIYFILLQKGLRLWG